MSSIPQGGDEKIGEGSNNGLIIESLAGMDRRIQFVATGGSEWARSFLT
jgi:hypothetical protein